MWRLISDTFDKILKNKYVDNFIIILILLNLTVFILQTEPAINTKYSTIIGQIELFTVIIFTIEYLMRLCTLKSFKEVFSPMMLVDLFAILPFYLSSITVNTIIVIEGIKAIQPNILRTIPNFLCSFLLYNIVPTIIRAIPMLKTIQTITTTISNANNKLIKAIFSSSGYRSDLYYSIIRTLPLRQRSRLLLILFSFNVCKSILT